MYKNEQIIKNTMIDEQHLNNPRLIREQKNKHNPTEYNGLRSRKRELLHLIRTTNAQTFCIQDSRLRKYQNFLLNGFKHFSNGYK